MAGKSDLTLAVNVIDQTAPGVSSVRSSVDRLVSDTRLAADRLGNAWQTLGVQTDEDFRYQIKAVEDAYQTIVASGTASKDELIRAELAASNQIAAIEEQRADKVVQIDEDAFSKRKGVIGRFYDWWKANVMAVVAEAYVVYEAMHVAFDLMSDAAKESQMFESLNMQAAKFGASSDTVIEKLNEITKGMIDEGALAQEASENLARHLSPEQLYGIAESARVYAKATGRDLKELLDDISQGIATGRSRTLESIAGMLEISNSGMTRTEQTQERYNLLMEKTAELAKTLNMELATQSDRYNQMGAAVKNTKDAAGALLNKIELFGYTVSGIATSGMNNALAVALSWAAALAELNGKHELASALIDNSNKRLANNVKMYGEVGDAINSLTGRYAALAKGSDLTAMMAASMNEQKRLAKETEDQLGKKASEQFKSDVAALNELATAVTSAGKAQDEFAKSSFDEALKSGTAAAKDQIGALNDARDTLSSYTSGIETTIAKHQVMYDQIKATLTAVSSGVKGATEETQKQIRAILVASLNDRQSLLKSELSVEKTFLDATVSAYKDTQSQIKAEAEKSKKILDSIYGAPEQGNPADRLRGLGDKYNDLVNNTQGLNTEQLKKGFSDLETEYGKLWDDYIKDYDEANATNQQLYDDGKLSAKGLAKINKANYNDYLDMQRQIGQKVTDITGKVQTAWESAGDKMVDGIFEGIKQVNTLKAAIIEIDDELAQERTLSILTSTASSAVKDLATTISNELSATSMEKVLSIKNDAALTAIQTVSDEIAKIPAVTTKTIQINYAVGGLSSLTGSGVVSTPAYDSLLFGGTQAQGLSDIGSSYATSGGSSVPEIVAPQSISSQSVSAQSHSAQGSGSQGATQNITISPAIHINVSGGTSGVDVSNIAKQVDSAMAKMWKSNRSDLRVAMGSR